MSLNGLVTGTFKHGSKNIFKKLKIKSNEPYGWATAAKVYVVLTYIYCLSQLGLNLPKWKHSKK